jgi:dUTP pyrophosphatase
MIIRYSKVRNYVKTPTRGNPSDAGLDVYFQPEDENLQIINPYKNKLFSTGLKFEIPHGYMLQAMNRSSVAAKKNLVVGACVIDSGYSGEVFIDLHNIGTEQQIIYPGDKIAQLVMIPVVSFNFIESETENLYNYPITISQRGSGALGSTDGKNNKL